MFFAVSLLLLGGLSRWAYARPLLIPSLAAAPPLETPPRELSFFFLVRQWPGTFCELEGSCANAEDPVRPSFTLHGLWPNYDDNTWPEYCDPGAPFDPAQVDDLTDRMRTDWPSLSGKDTAFWAHEWDKHGTCAAPVLSGEKDFFTATLDLHEAFSIDAALADAGIDVSAGGTFPAGDIFAALQDAFGVPPVLTCTAGRLSEVYLCVDRDMLPFECAIGPGKAAERLGASRTVSGLHSDQCSETLTLPAVPAGPTPTPTMPTLMSA